MTIPASDEMNPGEDLTDEDLEAIYEENRRPLSKIEIRANVEITERMLKELKE